jgi:hypothetical protein
LKLESLLYLKNPKLEPNPYLKNWKIKIDLFKNVLNQNQNPPKIGELANNDKLINIVFQF